VIPIGAAVPGDRRGIEAAEKFLGRMHARAERIGSQLIVRRRGGRDGWIMTTNETYTVKARNFECRAAKPTLEATLIVARERVWSISPDEKVQVYLGDELVGEIEQV
jgi:hypothetical protein